MRALPLRHQLLAVVAVTALLLLVPLTASQLTSEVNWGPGDYAVAAALLLCTGFAVVLACRFLDGGKARAVAVSSTLLLAALAWAELAVGLWH